MTPQIKAILLRIAPKFRARFIDQSGLFDSSWYSEVNKVSKDKSIQHYIKHGNKKDYSPSLVFYPSYYANQIERSPLFGLTYLEDYLLFGYKKRTSPTPYFDEAFYIKKYRDIANTDTPPLLHFMNYGWKEGRDPNPFFDTQWYVTKNPDIGFGKTNPLIHYIGTGYNEGRNPSPHFDASWYRANYLVGSETEPLGFFLAEGKEKGHLPKKDGLSLHTTTSFNKETFLSSINYYQEKGPFFKEGSFESFDWVYNLKLIAYYLPQFHAIPENNEWWGPGFTEWTNVTKGLPRFKGHYQPRLPRDLGFYQLDHVTAIKKQVELAKQYGLFGFCFHYYWFSGKRLLEKPLDIFLEDKSIEFPFCLCWANENWTRRWDGLEQEILIKQEFTKEDLSNFIIDIEKYIKDDRYIKINGRPIIIIYRPLLIPEVQEVISSWNEQLKQLGIEKPYWVAVQAFEMENPKEVGFDIAIEFPPHKVGKGLKPKNDLELFDPNYQGHVFDIKDIIKNSIAHSTKTEHPLIKTVFPSWDNEARKKGKGTTFINSTPQLFKKWLNHASSYAINNPIEDQSFVFINAWNEWAEGAYLEPDQHNGYAYLDIVKSIARQFNLSAAQTFPDKSDETDYPLKILVVSHDAYKHGAQLIALNIVKTLANQFGADVQVLLLEGGDLEDEFKENAPTFNLLGQNAEGNENLESYLENLYFEGFQNCIVNTTVAGKVINVLNQFGLNNISLIHELPSLIKEYSLEKYCKDLTNNSKTLIFPSKIVRNGFEIFTSINNSKIIPQGFYAYDLDKIGLVKKGTLREHLEIDDSEKIVIGVGFADLRKGIDIFVKIADQVTSEKADIHFVWVGNYDSKIYHWIQHDLAQLQNKARIHMLPFTPNISEYLVDSDLYLLTSREDPFPTVVIEALGFGKPVIGFENAGGIQEINTYGNILSMVPYLDLKAMATEVTRLLYEDPKEYKHKSELGKRTIKDNFRFDNYTFKLLSELFPDIKKVSVIIPNFNYAHTIEERLLSIWQQNYPIFEIIILDDCSSDNSLEVIDMAMQKHSKHIRVYQNESNSGSPFGQWLKGVEMARGDYIWIAEADDLAKPNFIEKLLPFFSDDKVGMAYAQSSQIDENGNHIADDYHYYTDEIDKHKWKEDYIESGLEEIKSALSIKNTILNVSSAIWRKEALENTLIEETDTMKSFSIVGDWYLYISFFQKYDIGFCAMPLNIHRRHNASITHRLAPNKHIKEIKTIHSIIKKDMKVNKHIKIQMDEYIDWVKRYLTEK